MCLALQAAAGLSKSMILLPFGLHLVPTLDGTGRFPHSYLIGFWQLVTSELLN